MKIHLVSKKKTYSSKIFAAKVILQDRFSIYSCDEKLYNKKATLGQEHRYNSVIGWIQAPVYDAMCIEYSSSAGQGTME